MRVREIVGVGFVLAMVTLGSGQAADVRVQVGDVKDTRTTGEFFANLEIELKLMGDDIDGAKGLRCKVSKAIDDTGRNLINEEKDENDFSDIDNDNPNRAQVTIQLKNPSRKAATVKDISGEIEIFKPDNDPTSMIIVTNLAGRPKISVSHPSLTTAQIQMIVLSKEQYDKDAKAEEKASEPNVGMEQMGEEIGKTFAGMFGGIAGGSKNSVIMRIKDPQAKLINVEFLDASGKVIRSEGSMTMGDIRSYDFSEPLPQGSKLRIYVATQKSVIKTPLVLKDLALP